MKKLVSYKIKAFYTLFIALGRGKRCYLLKLPKTKKAIDNNLIFNFNIQGDNCCLYIKVFVSFVFTEIIIVSYRNIVLFFSVQGIEYKIIHICSDENYHPVLK